MERSEQSPNGVNGLRTLFDDSEQLTPARSILWTGTTPRRTPWSWWRPMRNRSVEGSTVTATPASATRFVTIPDMAPESLGKSLVTIGGVTYGGFLADLSTGQANDLFTNPGNAIRVIDLALDEVNSARSLLGTFLTEIVEAAGRAADIGSENLRAADSVIRDADFAEEIAEMTRSQVQFQAGIAVMGQAHQLPQTVLELLIG